MAGAEVVWSGQVQLAPPAAKRAASVTSRSPSGIVALPCAARSTHASFPPTSPALPATRTVVAPTAKSPATRSVNDEVGAAAMSPQALLAAAQVAATETDNDPR